MSQLVFNFNNEENLKDDEGTYTKKKYIPQYEIKGEEPRLNELCDISKYFQLKQEINQCELITDEEKKFLIMAATRHLAFNYSKIAEYYAHANKTMQELMEKSALVIIDFDDAVAYGYAMLATELDKMSEEDYYEV